MLGRTHSKLSGHVIESLKSIFGTNYTVAEAIRDHHCRDESFHQFSIL